MTTPSPRRTGWNPQLAAALLLALLVLLSHGRSLQYGLFLDDLAHYRQLQEADWSLRGLVDACRLELVGGAVELWWLPETTLRFFRPLAFGLMKLAYLLGNWSPLAGHTASLIWHTVACWLLWCLLRRFTRHNGLSLAVAAIFAIHPAHVGTVQWIASQTELIVTAFLLLSILALDRIRGWSGPPAEQKRWWILLAVLSYAAALGCRENAILLPGIALAVDLLHRRGTLLRSVPLYAVLFAVAGGYLYLRSAMLGGLSLPPRPYIVAPSEPDFVRYIFDKLCYYLLGEFAAVPCVPIGGLPYLREYPLAFYGATALLLLGLGLVAWRERHQPLFTLGAISLLGFVGPVLPAFESPHHLYLPGIGAILILTAVFAPSKPARGQGLLTRGVLPGMLVVFAVLTHFSSLAIEAGGQVEDLVISEVCSVQDTIEDGDTLYVANLPLIAHYLRLGVEQQTGRRNLRVVALTWAPTLLGVTGDAELRRIDSHTVECHVAPQRYFSGPVARMIREAQGRTLTEMLQEPLTTRDFTVTLVSGDNEGIDALRFRFHESLDGPRVHLFWGSSTRWAAPLQQLLPGAARE